MRNIITPLIIAAASIAITPSCGKKSAESRECLFIERNIRVIAQSTEDQIKKSPGSTMLDDLCSSAIGHEHDAEIELEKYRENCVAPQSREDHMEYLLGRIRAERMEVCSHAYPDPVTYPFDL